MRVYPKTSSDFEGLDKLEPYVDRYNGIELQFFNENGNMSPFDFKSVVEKLLNRMPNIKEITIHPPLNLYEIECIISKDINIIKSQLKTMVKLSRKYNIKMNIVYHTLINFEAHKELTLSKIEKLLKIIEGENVTILLENLFMFFEKRCTVYEIANYFNHPNLKVCFDICHLHCRANINKQDVLEYAKEYLNPEYCKKYTYQVHFSYTANNDGYVDKSTHGIVHPNIEELEKDLKILHDYNMTNCNYITEVSEKNYLLREDQIRELIMLESAKN